MLLDPRYTIALPMMSFAARPRPSRSIGIPMKKKQKPAKKSHPVTTPRVQNERLKGWNEIASFLGQPIAVAQRWARSGMPVTREGRFMYASQEELSGYLGREAGLGVPVYIAKENMDLSADLKRALAHARTGNQDKKKKGNHSHKAARTPSQ
jgi:hypothetical protein